MSYNLMVICYVAGAFLLICGMIFCFTFDRYVIGILLLVLLTALTILFSVYSANYRNNNPIYYYVSVDGIDYVCDKYEITDTTIKLFIDDNTIIVLMLHYDSEILIKKGD